jgi:hypothetical protein
LDRVVWQFSTSHDIFGFVVRYGTRSKWSHVDAVLPNGSLLGARFRDGVQIRPSDYIKFPTSMRVCVETPYADKFYEVLLTQIGKPYDWRAIAAFAFGDRDWRDPDAWFCSELQIWAMEQAGFFHNKPPITADRLSPRDQLLLFSQWIEIIT